MNIREFIRRNYDMVRETGSMGIAVMVHVALFLLFCVVTFTMPEPTVRVAPTSGFKDDKPVVDTTKPETRSRDMVPTTITKTPKPTVPQPKADPRLTARTVIETIFQFTPGSSTQKRSDTFTTVMSAGQAIKNQNYKLYPEKFKASPDGKKAVIENFVVIKYEGGDWDCEFHHDGSGIVFGMGSIPNLIHEIERRTGIEVVNHTAMVVRADSPEIMKSPFVYFTGHQNFTLTEAEVLNLQTYLLNGFAIVANSSLPGRRSRFDVAFRREMKRVIPDQEFKPIDKNHRLLTSCSSFERVPVGMNYYAEPIEVITIENRDAVIYNLNDYGDLMLARLDDTGKALRYGERVNITKNAEGKEVVTPAGARWEGPRVWSQHTRGRNLYAGCDDPVTVNRAFAFNINILTYLLSRQ